MSTNGSQRCEPHPIRNTQLKGNHHDQPQHRDLGRQAWRLHFPAEWGEPVGAPYSRERAAWILRNVRNAPIRGSRSSHAALRKANALSGERNAYLALVKALSLK